MRSKYNIWSVKQFNNFLVKLTDSPNNVNHFVKIFILIWNNTFKLILFNTSNRYLFSSDLRSLSVEINNGNNFQGEIYINLILVVDFFKIKYNKK